VAGIWQAAHNRAVRNRTAAGVLAIVLVSAVTACAGSARSAQPARQAPVVTSPVPLRGGQVLGEPGCHPASPISLWHSFLSQVEGTGRGATLWGC
jgi:hypothetical protein